MTAAVEGAAPLGLSERAALYKLLASFFLDLPTEEDVRGVLNAVCGDEAETGDSECANSEAVMELRRYRDTVGVDDASVGEVAQDRTFLVRGVTKNGPQPPYAPLYNGGAQGAEALSVKTYYRQAGFEYSPDAHEAPDYLGVELYFAGRLLEKSTETEQLDGERLFSIANEFIKTQVIPFGLKYADEGLVWAKTGYCRGVLLLLKEFLEREAE